MFSKIATLSLTFKNCVIYFIFFEAFWCHKYYGHCGLIISAVKLSKKSCLLVWCMIKQIWFDVSYDDFELWDIPYLDISLDMKMIFVLMSVLSCCVQQLCLPMGVPVEVIVCSVVTPNHVFLQQPTHPTFPSLERQNYHMRLCYGVENVPHLPRPIDGKVSALRFPE